MIKQALKTNLQAKSKIPIVDLVGNYKSIQGELDKVVLDVLSSGHYILGKNVETFENELVDYIGCKYVISCANGTDALRMALMSLDIKAGDEVITISLSFFATAEAIVQVGATPVFVEVNEKDFNIDSTKIEALITKKTKAILPVHLYGCPCDIASITDIAKKHGLYVIEDCAQALGAKYGTQHVGTFGDVGVTSFFPTKNLGAFGDGGAIFTNNKNIGDKIRQLRHHGSSKRYEHNYIGFNSRLDEIQAAILRVKLKYLDRWNLNRQEAAKYYNELFKNLDGIIAPSLKPNCNHIFHQYTIRAKKRDLLYEKLKENDIETIIYYPIPIHLQKAMSYLKYSIHSLPITERLCSEILSIPMYPEITRDIQKYVVDNIKDVLTLNS